MSRITYKKKFSGKKRKTGRKKRLNNKKYTKKNIRGGVYVEKIRPDTISETKYKYKTGDKVISKDDNLKENPTIYEVVNIVSGRYGGPTYFYIKEDMFKESEQYKKYETDLATYNTDKSKHNDNYSKYHTEMSAFTDNEPNIEDYEKNYMESNPLIEVESPDDLILYMFNTSINNIE